MAGSTVVSTWKFGIEANEAARAALDRGLSALDAVERGARAVEDDPEVSSVGFGGLPDERMEVTLDASIMDWRGGCGAVAALPRIRNAVGVARAVMEHSPHVMLAGEGALAFALAHGFEEAALLTPRSRERWLAWKSGRPGLGAATEMSDPQSGHDTVGVLALDAADRLSGAVSTSGTAWKLHGRVGDSPIIGAGLYVDGEVGAAAATGVGEANMRVVGAHLIVEAMRSGASPAAACELAIRRLAALRLDATGEREFQLAYIAIDLRGEVGSAAFRPGFQYALDRDGTSGLRDPDFVLIP